MSSNRKVKGAIFRVNIFDHCTYYCGFHKGMSRNKADAYVYTKEEITKHSVNKKWAPKCDGTWVLVYE